MSFYWLDTNICIFLLNQCGGFENIIQRMGGMSREDIGISAISLADCNRKRSNQQSSISISNHRLQTDIMCN